MKYNNILNGILTVFVVAIMVGVAEILGEKEIIFPEITAIAIGMLIAPKRSWQVNRTRLIILIGVCSFIGLGISMIVFLPLWVKLSGAFVICQFIYFFSRTSFAPLISASVLPVMLGTTSIIYPISAIILTGIIIIINLVLEKLQLKEKELYIPKPLPHKQDYTNLLLRSLIGIIAIVLSVKFSFIFAVAPPVLVAFTEFTQPNSKAKSHPIKVVLLIFLCGLTGTIFRYFLTIKLDLPLTLSAILTTATIILILHLLKMYLPPAGALAILPMLIQQDSLLLYPIEILVGVSVFMAVALAVFRGDNNHRIKNNNGDKND